jgi:glucose-6-phosphate 1-dehydrogenase
MREALEATGFDPARSTTWCRERLHYHRLGRDGYNDLAERIREIEELHNLPGNRVFYLALPPRVFPTAIDNLGAAGLDAGSGWTRLVVEKPFGRDRASAQELDAVVHRHFDESQVYRIDHYLGKETVQNLLVFRFTNPIFEASWNRDRIARVEITVAESLGVGTRGGYYETAGAVRDMVQSHLAQVLSLIAMESPVSLGAAAIRSEKIKVLRSIQGVPSNNVVFGQYTAGSIGSRQIPGYRTLDGVDPASKTPTYAAIRLHVDNWRWQGVPFILRTGKALPERTTKVAVTFRPPPICLFHASADGCLDHSDVLTLTLQPDEGFRLDIDVKQPGDVGSLRTIPLRFDYAEEFGAIPEAYETLLRDVIQGDQTLFVHADEVDESWRLFTPVVEADYPVYQYAAGSWGPDEAMRLLGENAAWAVGSDP